MFWRTWYDFEERRPSRLQKLSLTFKEHKKLIIPEVCIGLESQVERAGKKSRFEDNIQMYWIFVQFIFAIDGWEKNSNSWREV